MYHKSSFLNLNTLHPCKHELKGKILSYVYELKEEVTDVMINSCCGFWIYSEGKTKQLQKSHPFFTDIQFWNLPEHLHLHKLENKLNHLKWESYLWNFKKVNPYVWNYETCVVLCCVYERCKRRKISQLCHLFLFKLHSTNFQFFIFFTLKKIST